jgi:hypothetical protein
MLKLKEYQRVYQEIKRVKSMANESAPLPPVGLQYQAWSKRGQTYELSTRRSPVLFTNRLNERVKRQDFADL